MWRLARQTLQLKIRRCGNPSLNTALPTLTCNYIPFAIAWPVYMSLTVITLGVTVEVEGRLCTDKKYARKAMPVFHRKSDHSNARNNAVLGRNDNW